MEMQACSWGVAGRLEGGTGARAGEGAGRVVRKRVRGGPCGMVRDTSAVVGRVSDVVVVVVVGA